YLAQVATTAVPNAGTSTSLTPGTVVTGFNITTVPRVLSQGRVMLQFSLGMSDLVKIDSASSGDNTIQIPEVNTRTFLQEVALNSGSTLVISGFDQHRTDVARTGTGTPEFWFPKG